MLPHGLTLAIRTVTLIAWLIASVALFPFGSFVGDELGRFSLLVAVVGSCHYLASYVARPAHEVYLAGKEAGRRELLREQAAGETVANLDDRRRLRATEPGERAVGGGRWLS